MLDTPANYEYPYRALKIFFLTCQCPAKPLNRGGCVMSLVRPLGFIRVMGRFTGVIL